MSPASIFLLLVLALRALITAEKDPRLDDLLLLWGPYRPNLYLGLRPRIPKTLIMGLMWANVDNRETITRNLRHTCEQDEGIAGYGWTAMTREGGTQTIPDPVNKVNITTEFVRIPGGDHGGSWGLRVKGVPRTGAAENIHTTAVFYIGVEAMGPDSGSKLECTNSSSKVASPGAVECEGNMSGLGGFKIHFPIDGGRNMVPPPTTTVNSLVVPEDMIWQAKSIFTEQLKISADTPHHLTLDNEPGSGNMHFVQKSFEGAFEFDVLFSSKSAPDPVTSRDLTEGVKNTLTSFSSRFESVFTPKAPFRGNSHTNFSQSLFSNLLGGMGYFYGDWKVDRSNAQEYRETDADFWENAAAARARVTPELAAPSELLSMVPSRPFFPRGFLWDEGFHLLVVLDWDIDLTLEVVKSWFALMDTDGWIAREQILGPEARSKVPPEFQIQYPQYANPPTLFLVVAAFVDRLSGNVPYSGVASQYLDSPVVAKKFLADLYPLLKRHYEWFRTTQAGDLVTYDRPSSSPIEGYRWRGRTSQLTLTSGLDDYPRAQPPHPGELHLDAISWVGSMAGALKKIAAFLGESSDGKIFSGQERAVKDNIENLHWSADDKAYCDATIENHQHVKICHKGYVSLFPFLAGLLGRSHTHLDAVLDLIHDQSELWSPYGLRSLSRKSPLYGTAENYWRSPIWLNINYLVVERLLDLAQRPGPYQQKARTIYTSLRLNLVSTVYNSWLTTGFAWEQYNPETGTGQRTQHFTGWTALVVKIMAFPDLESGDQVPGGRWSDEGPRWKRKAFMMAAVMLGLAIVFRRRLVMGWRRVMGWTRISASD